MRACENKSQEPVFLTCFQRPPTRPHASTCRSFGGKINSCEHSLRLKRLSEFAGTGMERSLERPPLLTRSESISAITGGRAKLGIGRPRLLGLLSLLRPSGFAGKRPGNASPSSINCCFFISSSRSSSKQQAAADSSRMSRALRHFVEARRSSATDQRPQLRAREGRLVVCTVAATPSSLPFEGAASVPLHRVRSAVRDFRKFFRSNVTQVSD